MILTASTIQQAVGCTAAVAAQWAQPLTDACTAFGISTPKRVAAFLAQVGHESTSLTRTVENLNYGAQGMSEHFNFPEPDHQRGRKAGLSNPAPVRREPSPDPGAVAKRCRSCNALQVLDEADSAVDDRIVSQTE
ncbi:hypothetical protein [Stenotrophomonas maltophilia]|uniref:hypothetical protein n=1 Tax=Stenotrophomonas maltophilia TaxID=40324 RepID=UPI0028952C3A|nr:hypothetical protein [Stenotrophomonas maltophilia]MDT3487487.1 hypothetical protein [Stenotrophomonas maltophilia]